MTATDLVSSDRAAVRPPQGSDAAVPDTATSLERERLLSINLDVSPGGLGRA